MGFRRWSRLGRMEIPEAHRNSDHLPKNLGLPRVSKNSHGHVRQGMRLQDDGITLDRAPATSISVAHFHKVDWTLKLRTPGSFPHLVLGFVHLHETARRKNGIHGEIFRSYIAIGESVIGKHRQLTHGYGTPLPDHAFQVRRLLSAKSRTHPALPSLLQPDPS